MNDKREVEINEIIDDIQLSFRSLSPPQKHLLASNLLYFPKKKLDSLKIYLIIENYYLL